jgi:hypothetical protein
VLFTGAVVTADRVTTATAGAVDHFTAGFGYTIANALVLDVVNPPQSFVKGIGVRTDGSVCATTTTAGSDTFIEGVRVTAAGLLVVESAAPTNITSGNPVTASGALAISP